MTAHRTVPTPASVCDAPLTPNTLSGHVVDTRFSSFVQEYFDESVQAVMSFLAGEKPLMSVPEGGYTVHVMASRRQLLVHDGVDLPAPGGCWMGYWDRDLAGYVSKRDYDASPPTTKMYWDALVQVRQYVPRQFWMNYAGFWHAPAYEKWFWDEGGHNFRGDVNQYWFNRIRRNQNHG